MDKNTDLDILFFVLSKEIIKYKKRNSIIPPKEYPSRSFMPVSEEETNKFSKVKFYFSNSYSLVSTKKRINISWNNKIRNILNKNI